MILKWQRLAMIEILVVIIADQITKFLVFNMVDIPEHGAKVILPFFSLVHWWNKGVSFGMFNGPNAAASQFGILVILTLVIVTLLMYSLTRSQRPLSIFAFGMIIGGALGNLVDRFHSGAVADFLYFHWHEHGFPAFNLADSCVCVGVGLLLLDGFLSQRDLKSASFIDD